MFFSSLLILLSLFDTKKIMVCLESFIVKVGFSSCNRSPPTSTHVHMCIGWGLKLKNFPENIMSRKNINTLFAGQGELR